MMKQTEHPGFVGFRSHHMFVVVVSTLAAYLGGPELNSGLHTRYPDRFSSVC